MYTLSREKSLSKFFCLSSGKRSALKENNLLPWVANYFLRVDFFQRGFMCRKSKQEVKKVISLVKMAEKLLCVPIPFKVCHYKIIC